MSEISHAPNDVLGGAAVAAVIEIRRFVNDEIHRVGRRLDADDGSEFEFVCECGDLACIRLVKKSSPNSSRPRPAQSSDIERPLMLTMPQAAEGCTGRGAPCMGRLTTPFA
jgi:hypothetical protein